LDELTRRYPGVPVALLGHSMGGRTALYVAGHDQVRAVVALAPWIEDADPVQQLAGRRLLIAHGERDRVTAPRASVAYARRAAEVAEAASFVDVSDEHHAMIRRARLWHDLATGFVLGVLYGRSPDTTLRADTRTVLREALAGQASLVV
jgi:dienelactone hydrolase